MNYYFYLALISIYGIFGKFVRIWCKNDFKVFIYRCIYVKQIIKIGNILKRTFCDTVWSVQESIS